MIKIVTISEKAFESQVKDMAKLYGWLLHWLANRYILRICHLKVMFSSRLSKGFLKKSRSWIMAAGSGLALLIKLVMHGCKKVAGVGGYSICTDGHMNILRSQFLMTSNSTICAGTAAVLTQTIWRL